ncbi:probable cationic amino acid transporter [Neocloeon triangulifer]|uniref:probable cationic amino acid transporter n=1 Tax=Neocloeon triangulifer TaxID=2078957 RepID=UPI00286FA6CF|nr:probable cationic amino acid transporter [Neocloeon triangulifer]XP_059468666.1 probable cationic amino acid transporter [Neocloeon triangulifer]
MMNIQEKIANVDKEALRRDGLTLFSKLIRTKNVASLQETAETRPTPQSAGKPKLQKCLDTLDLTSLGVGSCVGTGMYLVAGMVARNVAGPGVVISFIIAAVASIFSGACYAEFGVRVPNTTGSAYMYSYVTVGEFLAFVIGWNMVLEYLIGTSACACALSACFDALANGAISSAIGNSIGTIFGRPPDFLAFIITLVMMVIMAAGVKKSLIFNNILNVINLAVWVFIMTAGLFYVDSKNWTEHKGFLPYGWSGVLTGAATCFYAFIGFDIIATTGEEATNPKKSIPYAIVTSLVIILAAYVTSSMMLTLIVPYDEVDQESALVEMFGQVGAYKCKVVVAIGALAGLTVSMFGSMFPMPRIVYAMAKDGLIFRDLSRVLPFTGTPVLATLCSGLAASVAALVIQLEVLVEMMSIGTLLAYTLVSTCVLILRYQPHTTNLIDLLPEALRTPMRRSPSKDVANGQVLYGDQLRPDDLKSALEVGPGSHQPMMSGFMIGHASQAMGTNQKVLVRRVTRGSPDSDDTFPENDYEGDEYLVSDRCENKFYGSLPGGGVGGQTAATGMVGGLAANIGDAVGAAPGAQALGGFLSGARRRLVQALSYVCPGMFPWVDQGPATEESGMFVMKMVGLFYLLVIVFDLIVVVGVASGGGGWTGFFLLVFFCAILAVLLLISRKPQNKKVLMFTTPGLPFVPAIAVTVNIYLIFKLSILTLVRFTIWMSIGFIVYFKYGIKNSTLQKEQDEQDGVCGEDSMHNIELSVTKPQPPRTATAKPTRTTDPPPTSAAPYYAPEGGINNMGMVLDESQFPSWDD